MTLVKHGKTSGMVEDAQGTISKKKKKEEKQSYVGPWI